MDPSRRSTGIKARWAASRRSVATIFLGIALLSTGAVATFLSENGPGSATLVGAGAILLVLAFLDERIEWLKVGDVELHLSEAARRLTGRAADLDAQGKSEAADQLREEARRLLANASPAARAYEELRRTKSPDAARVAEMSKLVSAAHDYSRGQRPSAEAVRMIFDSGGDGERVYALSLMQADPIVADFERILAAISASRSAFEQNQALQAASLMRNQLSRTDAERLAQALRQQLADGYIARSTSRRRIAEELLASISNNHDEDQPLSTDTR